MIPAVLRKGSPLTNAASKTFSGFGAFCQHGGMGGQDTVRRCARREKQIPRSDIRAMQELVLHDPRYADKSFSIRNAVSSVLFEICELFQHSGTDGCRI